MIGGSGIARHGLRAYAIAVFVTLCCVLLAVAPAHAAKEVSGYFGNESGTSTADGGFNTARGVAVNTAGAGGVGAGTVYVVDSLNNRVQRFGVDGSFQAKFGATGTAEGQFSTPTGIAVDQADGSVYVFDQGNRRVAKYSATGTFQLVFGVGVDDGTTAALQTCTTTCFQGLNSTLDGGFGTTTALPGLAVAPPGSPNAGNLYVADPGATGNRRIQQFSVPGATGPAVFVAKVGATGTGNGQFGTNAPTRVAVDDAGRVYAIDSGNNRVQRFTSALVFDSIFAAAEFGVTPAPSHIAIDPGAASAGDASDDRVMISRPCTASVCPGSTVPTEERIKELSTAGTLIDTHIVQAGLLAFGGLAINTTTNRLYASSTGFGQPSTTAHRVWTIEDVLAPAVTIGMTTDVGSRGATFNGFVTPGGAPTGYHFEYSTNGTDWISFPPSDVSAGAGTSPVAVAQTIPAGLEPSTFYHVRLVAKHTFAPGAVTSLETTFTTQAAAPVVSPLADADPGTTTATLTGQVNPSKQATTYRFEYGTTTAYGSTTPDGDAGDGGQTVPATAEIEDLTPDTVYHYRLVAENASDETVGDDHTFRTAPEEPDGCSNAGLRTGIASNLPDCRAYEQVTPVDKNGFDAVALPSAKVGVGGPVTADGDTVAFQSFGSFADSPWGGSGTLSYRSRRDGDGWTTNALQPRPLDVRGIVAGGVEAFSPDMDEMIVSAGAALTADPADKNNYYFRNPTGGLQLLSAMPASSSAVGASDDLSHLVVDSLAALTAEPGQPGASVRKIYEVTGGSTRLVTRRPGDDAPIQDPAFLGSATGTRSTEGATSADGRHIFFTAPQTGDARTVYRRTDGTTTAVASPSKRTPADVTRAKVFQVATKDGNRVFFTSSQRMTDDANPSVAGSPGDLYRYDFEADELVDLSAGTPGLTRSDVQGVVAISGSGDRVYFTALGQVVPGQGVDGQPNLFLWEDDGTPSGRVRFISTMVPAVDVANRKDATNWSWDPDRTAQTTPDGGTLIFTSAANATGYDAQGTTQVYRYDVDGDGGDGQVTCMSCDIGSSPTGSSRVPIRTDIARLGLAFPRFVTEDGERVVFSSPDSLVDRDSNGKLDAYVWEDGQVSLLSTGNSSSDSFAFGIDASGDDAFFRTRTSLVPQDTDTLVDVYTAHVLGGFESQQKAPREDCDGDSCQGPPQIAPPAQDPSSSGNRSSGNVKPTVDCSRFQARAKQLASQGKRLRRMARRTASERRARSLRRRAASAERRAKLNRTKAKRCTRLNAGGAR